MSCKSCTRVPAARAANPQKPGCLTIAAKTYSSKGGPPAQDRVLPGAPAATTGWRDAEKTQPKTDPEGKPYGGGRADIRMAIGGDGELYVLRKRGGMIRKMVSVVPPPTAGKAGAN